MDDKWKAAYQPLEEMQEVWFEDLLRDVIAEEWTSSLQDVKPKSAPGLTGI
ncbi:134_t:CDS:1, partial [Gigaspora margarita]